MFEWFGVKVCWVGVVVVFCCCDDGCVYSGYVGIESGVLKECLLSGVGGWFYGVFCSVCGCVLVVLEFLGICCEFMLMSSVRLMMVVGRICRSVCGKDEMI